MITLASNSRRVHQCRLRLFSMAYYHTNADVSVKLFKMVHAFRIRGHFAAYLDPLDMVNPLGATVLKVNEKRARWLPEDPQDAPDIVRLLKGNETNKLDLSSFNLNNYLLDKEYNLGNQFELGDGTKKTWTISSLINFMSECYCGSVGVEFGHIENEVQQKWLINKIETEYGPRKWGACSHDEQKRTLDRLTRSDHLEKFLGSKYASSKRFGIEGCEALLPGLWALLEAA
eukprot:gene9113-18881_t